MLTYKIEDIFDHINDVTQNTIQIPNDIETSYGEIRIKIKDTERKFYSIIEKGDYLCFSWNILNTIFENYVVKSIIIIINTENLKPINDVLTINEVLVEPIWNVSFPDFDFSNSIREYFTNHVYLCSKDCIKVPINSYDYSFLLSQCNHQSLFTNHFFLNISNIFPSQIDECPIYKFNNETSKMILQTSNVTNRRVFDIDIQNRRYSDSLNSVIDTIVSGLETFKLGSLSAMLGRPLIHVLGPNLSGKGTLISDVAHVLGHQFVVFRLTELVGQTSSAMEKKLNKILSLIEHGNFLSVHFEDFDGFFLNSDPTIKDKYDPRTIRVFTKIIESLSKVDNDNKEIILFLSTVNDVSPEIRRYIFLRFDAGPISDDDRMSIVKRGFGAREDVVDDLVKLSIRTPRIELISIMRALSSLHLQSRKDIADKFKSIALSCVDRDSASIESVSWKDIGGLAEVIQEVLLTVKLILSQHKPVKGYTVRKSGILLFGDPGTGKTLLAKAVASECNLNFISVKGPELLNMYVGQTEENVRALFAKVKRMVPCLLFCDELDSLVPRRGFSGDSGGVMDRVVSQFAMEMDSINNEENMRVIVMGATNRHDLIDPALLRNGRFDKIFHIKASLSKNDQLEILKSQTYKLNMADDVDLNDVVSHFPEGAMTGAIIFGVVSTAVMNAIRRTIAMVERDGVNEDEDLTLSSEDFLSAIDSLK